MKRCRIHIRTQGDGAAYQVDAWDPGVPGLAVNRNYRIREDGEVTAAQGWVVTHTASGARVNTLIFARRDQARAFAMLLGDIEVDWTLPAEGLRTPGLARAVAEVEALVRSGMF